MLIGFQTNVKDSKEFKLSVKREYDGQVEEFVTNEGIAIMFNSESNNLTTTGCMSTEHIITAMEHLFKCVIQSYGEKHPDNKIGFIVDCAKVLDGLDDLINERMEANATVDDFGQKQ